MDRKERDSHLLGSGSWSLAQRRSSGVVSANWPPVRRREFRAGPLDADGVAVHLRTLGDERVGTSSRAESARVISHFAGALARWMLRTEFRRLTAIGQSDRQFLVDEVIQAVLIAASTGRARFESRTDGAAFRWCQSVIRRALLVELRAEGLVAPRRKPLAAGRAATAAPQILAAEGQPQVSETDLATLCEAVYAKIVRGRRPRYAPGLARAFQCFVASRMGVSVEEQMRIATSATLKRPGLITKRSIDWLYKRRERGREAGKWALAGLHDTLTEAELAAARWLGLLE